MQCFVILSENHIQEFFYHTVNWFVQKFAESTWDNYVPMVHLGLIFKNSKRTSKGSVFPCTEPEKSKEDQTGTPGPAILIFSHPFCCKISNKRKGSPLETLDFFNFRKQFF